VKELFPLNTKQIHRRNSRTLYLTGSGAQSSGASDGALRWPWRFLGRHRPAGGSASLLERGPSQTGDLKVRPGSHNHGRADFRPATGAHRDLRQ
jgi:hypothetical protein